MAVKCSELQIGDWVLFDGEPKQVQEILFDEVTIECWPKSITEIEPIPLTAEILEKNGFMNIEGEFYLGFGDYKIVFDKHNDSFIIKELDANGYFYNIPILEVTYIHELQHALRLCGIEKEIIL